MKTGIYDMPMSDYLAIDALSSGVAHTILSASPMHARFEQTEERKASSKMDIGTYAHKLLLEGNSDGLVICPFADWRKDAAKEMRDAAWADGKLPILVDNVAAVEAMVKAAREYVADSEIAGIFDSGKPEQTIVWQEGDILLKARPDWLSDDYLLHVKTTGASVSPRPFSRLAANSGYDFALAFYMRGLQAVKPDADVNHVILAIEQTAPYACKLFDLTAARRDVANMQVVIAIQTWMRCQSGGKFPAYDGTIHSIDIQTWELAQAEEDMLTDDELNGGIPA